MANSADPDQKLTDLDLHCLQMQVISGFSRQGFNTAPEQYSTSHKSHLLSIVFTSHIFKAESSSTVNGEKELPKWGSSSRCSLPA